jgi:protein TonB
MNPRPKSPSRGNKEGWRRYALMAGVGIVFSGGALAVYSVVHDGTQPRKRVMETIALKLVPPPPPPPAPPPPPPPPKMVEPQKIQPPIDKPDEKPQAPRQGPLALDAQAGPGGDAFGLGGNPGGAPICLGCGNGGGGGGGAGRFAHYATLMQDQIGKRLHQDDKLDVAKFRATIRVWLNEAGKVERVEIARSTGDGQLDDRIQKVIGTMPAMPEALPSQMPQPVVVRLGATPGLG